MNQTAAQVASPVASHTCTAANQFRKMITANGYSKDPSIMPEGICLTLPKQFFDDRGWSPAEFEKYFERFMQNEDHLWNFRLTNLPTVDVAWVYLIFENFLQFRVNVVMYERNVAKTFNDSPDGKPRVFPPSNWIILSGPAIRCPFERELRGFQGFRYCTKLF